MDEHTNLAILGFFSLLLGKQEFSQKLQLRQFWVFKVPQLMQNIKKTIETILRKMLQ